MLINKAMVLPRSLPYSVEGIKAVRARFQEEVVADRILLVEFSALFARSSMYLRELVALFCTSCSPTKQ
jgi:hypothetical protein